MQITWHGLSCFEIQTKTPVGEVTVVVDPYDNNTGLRFPRTLEADAVVSTHKGEDAENLAGVTGSPLKVTLPGEYERKGVFLFGIQAGDQMLLRIEAEKMHLAHLGALNRALTSEELEGMKHIDILMVPVGGGRVMTPKVAVEVIEQIEPRVVIPMTYALENVKESLGTLQAFCKEMGVVCQEPVNKYKVTRKDLPEEDMTIIALTR